MKTKMLRVRFDDNQWEELQRLAQKSGLSMSELVRDKMKHKTIHNRKNAQEMIRATKQISNNVNQIAKWVNTHKSEIDRIHVLSYLSKIMQQQNEIKEMISQ